MQATLVCCYGGATNKTSTMCMHQQHFRRDGYCSTVVLIITISIFNLQRFGLYVHDCRYSSKPCSCYLVIVDETAYRIFVSAKVMHFQLLDFCLNLQKRAWAFEKVRFTF